MARLGGTVVHLVNHVLQEIVILLHRDPELFNVVINHRCDRDSNSLDLSISIEHLVKLLHKFDLPVWLLDVPHSLGRGNDVHQHFLAFEADDQIWPVRILLVVESYVLLVLIDKVVLQGHLMVNASHRQTPGETGENPLFERVEVRL